MQLIQQKKKYGTLIGFYADYKSDSIGIHRYFSDMIGEVVEHDLLRGFRKVEVVFKVNKNFKNNFHKIVKKTLEGKTMGWVKNKDVSSGKNRVYIDLGVIFAVCSKQLGIVSNKEMKKATSTAVKETMKTIIHEITHLWHLRINNSRKIVKKNIRRIKKAKQNLLKNIKDKGDFWAKLRLNLLLILENIVDEGITNFLANFSVREIDYSNKSLKEVYGNAYKKSKELNKRLGKAYSDFINSKKKSDKELLNIAKDMAIYGYVVGMHVYQVILFVNEDATLDKLAKMNYRGLLRLYEQSCSKLKWKPVISLFSKDGVFSYPTHVQMLTKLRKQS